jgi:hypothetical protein
MKIENLVYKMITESTGIHLLDSGMGEGRHWQQNQKKTLKDFQNEKPIDFEIEGWRSKEDKTPLNSKDINYTVSIYHYLTTTLELGGICNRFNRLKCEEWNADYYGISQKQQNILIDKLGLNPVWDSFNTYNGDETLSQTLQGQFFSSDGTDYPDYVLLQIHNGADVRGGYTDAKLFKLEDDRLIQGCPTVYGTIDGIDIESSYDGYNLLDENGQEVPITIESKIELYL